MPINAAQHPGYVKPTRKNRWRRWGSPSVSRLQSSLVGLERYDWLGSGHRDRQHAQQLFFAALFVSLGSILSERWTGGRAVSDFVGTIQRALDLCPFHRDMADRLVDHGRRFPRLSEMLVERFVPFCIDDPELAELFVEVLCDACSVCRQNTDSNLTEYVTVHLGQAEEWLAAIKRRVNRINEEKSLVAATPGYSASRSIQELPEIRCLPLLPVAFAS